MTPRQFAHEIALDWLRAVHQEKTGDLADLTPAKRRDTLAAIAKLHNKILAESGLDGLPLGE